MCVCFHGVSRHMFVFHFPSFFPLAWPKTLKKNSSELCRRPYQSHRQSPNPNKAGKLSQRIYQIYHPIFACFQARFLGWVRLGVKVFFLQKKLKVFQFYSTTSSSYTYMYPFWVAALPFVMSTGVVFIFGSKSRIMGVVSEIISWHVQIVWVFWNMVEFIQVYVIYG